MTSQNVALWDINIVIWDIILFIKNRDFSSLKNELFDFQQANSATSWNVLMRFSAR